MQKHEWTLNVNWNKWDRERQILFDFTYKKNLKKKKPNSKRRQQTDGCQRWGLGWEKMGEMIQNVQTSNCKINKSWGCHG